MRTKFTTGLITTVVALTVWCATSGNAQAFWRWHGSSGGSWGGSWGSSGGSSGGSWGSCGSSGGSYGSWGSCGGWGWRRHRVFYHSYGSWGSSGGSSGGWGSYGSSGGSYGSWGSSGGSNGSSGGGYVVPDENAAPEAPAEAPAKPAEPAAAVDGGSAMLRVSVPEDATVYVNDLPTTSTGSYRRYLSRDLNPGSEYVYEVRVEVERNGEKLVETKTTQLRAGRIADLEFGFDGSNSQENVASKPKTSLTVYVPEDAKVFLAGRETTSTGTVRNFSTNKLTGDSEWADYVVRVEVERDGRTLAKESTITLRAGESREATFDFESPQVARVDR